MGTPLFRSLTLAAVLLGSARMAGAQSCITIDEAHDMLTPRDRTAALVLLQTQFRLAGEEVVDTGCAKTYTVSHVQLGRAMTVTMIGPNATREGKALDLDDLPPLYNQMVRSILSGEPMGTFRVIDRTNVTAAQNVSQRRVQSDGFWYARLGYAGIFGPQTTGAPAIGFGYRAEFDSFGVDFSLVNNAISDGGGNYASTTSASAGSWVKLEGMYFTKPLSNRTPYVGGGLSWGGATVHRDAQYFSGSGMQGELTAGYEIGRAASVRFFMQADAVLPFYSLTSSTYTSTRLPNGAYNYSVSTDHRYAPQLMFSIGVGWQKGRG